MMLEGDDGILEEKLVDLTSYGCLDVHNVSQLVRMLKLSL